MQFALGQALAAEEFNVCEQFDKRNMLVKV